MKTMEKTQKLLLTTKQVGSSASKEIKRRREEFEKIHIPNEIIEEIMVKLPVKSLMRFQTVSKHWRSLIRSEDFGERHMALEQTKECKLLLACSNNFEDLVTAETNISFKTVALENTSASVVDEEALEFEVLTWWFKISQSCDGLFCLYDSNNAVKVINPATKMFIQLPLSRIQQLCIHKLYPDSVQDPNPVPYPGLSFSQFGFGKDSVTRRYKLVWLYNTLSSTTTTCEVLDLEEKTWRFVNTNTLDHHNILNPTMKDQGPVFANGSLYWLTGDENGNPTPNTKLIVFDIHTEMFQVVQTPPFINSDTYGHDIGLCNLHGRLCISELIGDKQEFWWRVKDNTWESIFSVHLPSTYSLFGVHFARSPLTPLAICRDTNKVILGLRSNGNLVALDLNPDHSTDYHLYFSCFDRLLVPYFPSLSLSFY